MPKGIRLKPEQIVAKLREIEVKIGQGKDVLTACREAGATDKSYYRLRDSNLTVLIAQSELNHAASMLDQEVMIERGANG